MLLHAELSKSHNIYLNSVVTCTVTVYPVIYCDEQTYFFVTSFTKNTIPVNCIWNCFKSPKITGANKNGNVPHFCKFCDTNCRRFLIKIRHMV